MYCKSIWIRNMANLALVFTILLLQICDCFSAGYPSKYLIDFFLLKVYKYWNPIFFLKIVVANLEKGGLVLLLDKTRILCRLVNSNYMHQGTVLYYYFYNFSILGLLFCLRMKGKISIVLVHYYTQGNINMISQIKSEFMLWNYFWFLNTLQIFTANLQSLAVLHFPL